MIAYELMIGARPFCADTIEEVVSNITHFAIEWPEVGSEEGMISPEAKNLIEELLNRNFMERLGAKDVEQIKQHEFFEGIDWANLKSVSPLYKPKLTDFKQCLQMQNDPKLRSDLEQFIDSPHIKNNKPSTLKKLVRFDLLED